MARGLVDPTISTGCSASQVRLGNKIARFQYTDADGQVPTSISSWGRSTEMGLRQPHGSTLTDRVSSCSRLTLAEQTFLGTVLSTQPCTFCGFQLTCQVSFRSWIKARTKNEATVSCMTLRATYPSSKQLALSRCCSSRARRKRIRIEGPMTQRHLFFFLIGHRIYFAAVVFQARQTLSLCIPSLLVDVDGN